jgi:hypothetical protein
MNNHKQFVHTPGTWEPDFDDVLDGSVAIGHMSKDSDEDWSAFARVVIEMEGEPSAQGKANAFLIAASPDLLAACRLALSGTTHPAIEPVLKAAIAKAERRS